MIAAPLPLILSFCFHELGREVMKISNPRRRPRLSRTLHGKGRLKDSLGGWVVYFDQLPQEKRPNGD
jgi:hypothetical protein